MGDIDSDNFSESLVLEFAQAASSAEFIAIDLEMSGISFPHRTEGLGDTLPYRYKCIREIASTFGVIQVGVSLFLNNTAKVYNFYVFPRPVTECGGSSGINSVPQLSLCSASMNFNRSNGMDFQRWIDKGITYVNRDLEKLLEDLLLKKSSEESCEISWSQLNGSNDFSKDSDYSDQETEVIKQVGEFMADKSLTLYKVPFIHGGQKSLKSILAKVHAEYPSLRLVEEVSGGGTRRVLSKQTGPELFNEYVGFRKIWSILTSAGKPLIVHNGFLDLMFCYSAFESKLPETINEFRAELGRLFPGGVFDTRVIAMESGIAKGGAAALETLVAMFDNYSVDVSESGKYNSIGKQVNGDNADTKYTFHEAGYDAYLTGKVFSALRAKLDSPSITQWANIVCVARCLWALSFNGGLDQQPDRVFLDCGINKTRIVRYLTDLPSNSTVREILSTFESVKEVVNSAAVNVQWINDTSAYLLVTWNNTDTKTSTNDAVMIGMNSKLIEITRNCSYCLGTVSDAVKRQLN